MATGSAATLPVDPSSTWLHVFPIHSAGVYATAGAAMLGGGRVVLADFEPAAVLDLVEVKQVTHFVAGVTMWEMIVRAAAGRSTRLGSLRHALWGGQPMMPATAERVRSLLPVPCVGNYGLTEATCATYGSPEHGDPSASVGWPVHSMEVRIADDDGNDVPDGECGEVLLRGALVMTGYHRRPDETAVAVRDGWLHTGDWGRLDEAGLTVLDRKKDMVITGGENVYPSELEASLSRLEGVRAVAIVGVPDELWGQAVCAFVVAGGSGLRADDVVRHARRHHAGYKVPKHVVFVDDLPRNAIGKVRKQDLRKDFESYAGNPSRSRPGGR